jgi:hypothetical protein
MASGAYQYGIMKVLDGTIDLDTTALKWFLAASSYTYNPDHDGVDDLTEITATNYTGGFNGSGRKSASVALAVDNTNNKVIVTFTDPATWTALGGATNATIGAIVLIREITNDAGSIPIVYLDFTDVTTNGGDFSVDMANAGANGGNLQFAV